MVYFANLCVNLRDRLCDVARHVSAQTLDFLDLDEISSFLNWKHSHVPIHKKERSWMDTRLAESPIESPGKRCDGIGLDGCSHAILDGDTLM